MPTISPARTSREMSRRTLARLTSRSRRTSAPSGSAGRSRDPGSAPNSSAASPNIMPTSWSRVVSGTSRVPTVRPSRKTVTVSASPASSSRWCVTQIRETPRSRSRRMCPNRWTFSSSSRPEVGSSRMSSRGSNESALTISTTRFFSAPNSPTGSARSPRVRPNSAASAATWSAIPRRSSRTFRPRTRELVSRPRKTLSRVVSAGTRESSWWIVVMPAARASLGRRMSRVRPDRVIDALSARGGAGQHVDQRRLAGAVAPEQRVDLGRSDPQAGSVQGGDPLVPFDDVPHVEQRLRGGHARTIRSPMSSIMSRSSGR